jgi:HK97 gp10 family phage protein
MAVRGVNNAISQIRNLGQQAIRDMEAVTEQTARDIELKAKTLAPTDLGKLGQSIRAEKVTAKRWKIVAGGLIAPYAPFVEFGTGTLVQVPSEWIQLASEFKGKKIGLAGSDFLQNIKDWCRHRGIEEKFAFAIMLKLLRVGQKPQPYMYPAYIEGRNKYLERLKAIVRRYGSNR